MQQYLSSIHIQLCSGLWDFLRFRIMSHQMEAELDAVDVDEIFKSKFQGPNYPQTLGVDGRCGSVHNPPNARVEYDRGNPEPQPSDCLDWDPDGLGELSALAVKIGDVLKILTQTIRVLTI